MWITFGYIIYLKFKFIYVVYLENVLFSQKYNLVKILNTSIYCFLNFFIHVKTANTIPFLKLATYLEPHGKLVYVCLCMTIYALQCASTQTTPDLIPTILYMGFHLHLVFISKAMDFSAFCCCGYRVSQFLIWRLSGAN